MHEIVLLLMDQFILGDAAGAIQVFGTANEQRTSHGQERAYTADFGTLDSASVSSSSGPVLSATCLPGRMTTPAHTLIVLSSAHSLDRPHLDARSRSVLEWIRTNAASFQRIASVGKTAFLLVHASRVLMPLQPWMAVNAGSGVELALAMVQNDLGESAADWVAAQLANAYGRRLLVRLRADPTGRAATCSRLERLHRWMEDHLNEPLPVQRLARELSMTPRTFARYYRRLTGITPAKAVHRLRIERACTLIASCPGLSLKAISLQTGYASEEVMRRAFLRSLRISPTAYRQHLATGKE